MNRYFFLIEQMIASGKFKPGEALPTAADLAEELGGTETEIAHALSELVYEGALERLRPQPGDTLRVPSFQLWGTLTGHHSITGEAKKRGVQPGVEIVNWELADAWPSIQKRLALEPGDKVQLMERLRTADGEPVAIEISYFPAKFYPGITPDLFTEEGTGQSSFAVMEQKFGLVSDRAVDEVTVVCLEKREADLLCLEPGTPVLQRFRVTLSDQGVPIKASRAVWKFRAGYQMSLKK